MQAQNCPDLFRGLLFLPGRQERPFLEVAQPWQLRDLAALDPAWMELAGAPLGPVAHLVQRSFIERPRGHSKTSDMAVQIAWILLAAREPLRGLAAAADREQATFLWDALRRLAAANAALEESLQFVEHAVRNRETGSQLQIISSDARSSYGALPDFVVCDELTHWPKPDLWHSLLSSAAKKPNCVLTILTNAGAGRGWQWEVREHARTDPRWYFSSLQGPQAPWITQAWLDEQRALLPQPVFERLWLNRWQDAEGNFLTLAEVETCRDGSREYRNDGDPHFRYVAALDYAEKRDDTVGCVVHREGNLVIVDRMDVVRPTSDSPTRISWVENWIEDVASRFPRVTFIVDEYQLIGTVQRLEGKYPIDRFRFRGTQGHHELATHLRHLILHQRVRWYPGCGAIAGPHRDDLETELSSLLLKQNSAGTVRIDHKPDGRHHDDRAFTLGAACLTLLQLGGRQEDFLEISLPGRAGEFVW